MDGNVGDLQLQTVVVERTAGQGTFAGCRQGPVVRLRHTAGQGTWTETSETLRGATRVRAALLRASRNIGSLPSGASRSIGSLPCEEHH